MFSNFLYSECSDLDFDECMQWPDYCEWDEELGQCQDIGGGSGGGGDNSEFGPYDYSYLTESDGLRNGPDYDYARLYYPIDGNPPYKNIIMTPGWSDDGTYISVWGEFFASHGFVAMIIGPNDPVNDDHGSRGQGLIDAIETVKQENDRDNSPLYGSLDTESFTVSGYSMGGGAAQSASILDGSISTAISLNPTFFVYDTENCESPYYYCLIPEHLNHSVPTLIFAGETELNEMGPDYDGFLGQTIYEYLPVTTEKILYEVANQGHGALASPSDCFVCSEYIIDWLNYQVLGYVDDCESFLGIPDGASQYLTNIECSESIEGDINGDLLVNIQDIVLAVNLVLSNSYENSADLNFDGIVNILDVVVLVNIILF